MICPMCFSKNTPSDRITCIDCGYMALAMSPFARPDKEPSTERLKQCVAAMRGGVPPARAARQAGIASQSAMNAFLRYIVLPEWAEFKADDEQYAMLDAPNHKAA